MRILGTRRAYIAAHQAVVAQFGPASDYTCSLRLPGCRNGTPDAPAYMTWALDPRAGKTLPSRQGAFSMDLRDYFPACRGCHKKLAAGQPVKLPRRGMYARYRHRVSPSRGRTFPPEVLTRREIDALLAAFGRGWVAARNRALIVTLWRTGLRIAEALALLPHDLDLEARTVRVRHGKGDKARTVALDARTVSVLRDWLPRRDAPRDGPERAPGGPRPVFCTRAGKPIHDTYVRTMLARVAARTGIERRVHPHMFRHTYAVELVREGVPVPMIQRLLGHTSLATTSTYLAALSPEEALDRVRVREW